MSTSELPTPPKSGYELSLALKVNPTEGVEVALFPGTVEEAELGEPFRWSVKSRAMPVWGILASWGRRLLDLVVEPSEDVKWWKVKQYAKAAGANLVPVRYEGPIVEIPERYFEPGTVLGVRLYSAGPWFWPLEKPAITVPEHTELQTMADKLNILKGYTTDAGKSNEGTASGGA